MKTSFTSNPVNSKDALELGGLNFNVTKLPIQTTSGGALIPDNYATWRTDKIGSPEGYLGVVGNTYKPIQNSDCLGLFDSIFSKEELVYTEAGYTNNGNKVWLKTKLPDTISLQGDEIEKYIVLSNSHDGTSGLNVKFLTVRLVCTNGLTASVLDAKSSINIRHSSNAKQKIDEAYKVLNIAKSTFKQWEENISKLSQIKISPQDLDLYYNRVLKIKDVKDASTRVMNTKETFNELFHNGIGVELNGGTVWTAINSITEYTDHHRNYKNNQKDYGTLFGSGDVLKTQASLVAQEMFLI